MNRIENSCGEIMELLPVGTRVQYKGHPELTGEIICYEYHEGGKVSPVPYKVYWDNHDLAHKVIGFFSIYPHPDKVESTQQGGDK